MGRSTITAMPFSPVEGSPALQRLLIPVDTVENSRQGVSYAIDVARSGVTVEACLLYIAAPARNWEALRFRTDQDLHGYMQDRSSVVLEEAATHLRAAGIPYKSYFRETEPVFGILDLAEQLDCTGIVVPKPDWRALITKGIGRSLKAAQRSIPILLVRPDGSVEP